MHIKGRYYKGHYTEKLFSLSYLLFVGDAILFGMGTIREVEKYKELCKDEKWM